MEDNKLNKIDEIVKRTGVSYETAKQLLEEADGDVLEAVILAESRHKSDKNQGNKVSGEDILDEIKKIIEKGNATKLTIKKNNEIILNLPITAGAVGVVMAPILALTGITAALLTQCTVEIQQADGNIVDVNAKVDKGMESFKSGMETVRQTVADGAENIKDTFEESSSDIKKAFKDM